MQPESKDPETGEFQATDELADSTGPTLFDDFEVIGLDEDQRSPADQSDPREESVEEESVEVVHEATATEDQAWSEWFSDSQDGILSILPRRHHHVTAVVVSHDGATWLPAVLTTLANQTRPADAVVGVDTGSLDDSPNLLRRSLGSDRVIVVDRLVGFGSAVLAGLAHVGEVQVEPSSESEELATWVWLLHDDSAPNAS